MIEKIEIYFENELKRKLGEKPYKFVNNPNTPAGWQRPYCPFYIDEKGKNVRILAKVKIDGKTLNVGGYIVDKKGKPLYAFIPEYLISPFLLVSQDTSDYDFSKPILDNVGKKIITTLLKIFSS